MCRNRDILTLTLQSTTFLQKVNVTLHVLLQMYLNSMNVVSMKLWNLSLLFFYYYKDTSIYLYLN